MVDPLFGTTREYLDHILLENQIPVTVIHNTRDPYFGGYAPDCTSENLTRLRDVMRRTGARLGLATDGDGDRFGILDQGARMKDSSSRDRAGARLPRPPPRPQGRRRTHRGHLAADRRGRR